MIFIGFFLFIALIAVSLNMMNSSNLEQIEDYLKSKNCTSITYSKGSYKALCNDKILDVANSFTIDLKKNTKEYSYSNITNIKVEKLDILLNDKEKLQFKSKDELYKFYEDLKDEIKK